MGLLYPLFLICFLLFFSLSDQALIRDRPKGTLAAGDGDGQQLVQVGRVALKGVRAVDWLGQIEAVIDGL